MAAFGGRSGGNTLVGMAGDGVGVATSGIRSGGGNTFVGVAGAEAGGVAARADAAPRFPCIRALSRVQPLCASTSSATSLRAAAWPYPWKYCNCRC